MASNEEDLDVVDIVIEFLEVSIHHLLFLRNLYPASIFVPRKIYNIPVQVSKHPKLNEYITESLRSVRSIIRHGCLKSVVVCFYDNEQVPVERFVFDIIDLKENFSFDHNMSDAYLQQLKDGFRAFSLKMAATDFKPLTEDHTFQIHICTTEQGSHALFNDPSFEDFPWIELEDREKKLPDPVLAPIRTVESEFLRLQMYREMSP